MKKQTGSLVMIIERHIRRLIILIACSSLASCATPALWDATNPRDFVAVSKTSANEEKLNAKGLSYRVDPNRDLIYVEKTPLQKTRDYAIRAIGTPVTVVIDTATTLVVVGAAVCLLSHDTRSSDALEAERMETQRQEMEAKRIDQMIDDIRLQEMNIPSE